VGSGDPKVLIYFTAVVSVEDLPELLSFDIIDVDAQLAKPQQLSTSSNFRFEQLQQLSCNLMQLPRRQQFILHSFYLNGLLDKSTATSSRKLLIPASPAPEYEVASNCHCQTGSAGSAVLSSLIPSLCVKVRQQSLHFDAGDLHFEVFKPRHQSANTKIHCPIAEYTTPFQSTQLRM